MLKTRSEKGVKRDSMSLDLVADHFRQGLQAKSLGGWVNDADIWGAPQFEFLVSHRQHSGVGAWCFLSDLRWIVFGRKCWQLDIESLPVKVCWTWIRIRKGEKVVGIPANKTIFAKLLGKSRLSSNRKSSSQCHDRGTPEASEGQWHIPPEIKRATYLMMLRPAKLLMTLLVDLEKSLFRWLALAFRSPQSWTTKRAVMELWASSFVW